MAVTADQQKSAEAERISLYMTPAFRQRVKRAAAQRMCTENAAIRWLLSKALDWYEEQPRADTEALS